MPARTRTRVPDVVAAAEEIVALVDLADEIVACRAIGHAWDDNPGGEISGPLAASAYAIARLRCTRCTMERFDYLGAQMDLIGRYYRKPPRWRRLAREEATRPVLRGELLGRSLLIRRLADESRPRRKSRKVA